LSEVGGIGSGLVEEDKKPNIRSRTGKVKGRFGCTLLFRTFLRTLQKCGQRPFDGLSFYTMILETRKAPDGLS